MTQFFAYLDGLPLGPVALFALGYGVFLVVLLTWIRSRRPVEHCDRCGREWKWNPNGSSYHLCQPRRDQAYP